MFTIYIFISFLQFVGLFYIFILYVEGHTAKLFSYCILYIIRLVIGPRHVFVPHPRHKDAAMITVGGALVLAATVQCVCTVLANGYGFQKLAQARVYTAISAVCHSSISY